jgi:hypothetical protein
MIPRPIRSAALRALAAALLLAPVAARAQEEDSSRTGATKQDSARDTLTLGERAPAYDWKARSRAFLHVIPVFPADSSDSVTVRVSTLRSRSGEEIPVRAWFGTDTLRVGAEATPLAPAMLRLRAALPDTGEYRGTFTLVVPGRPVTTAEYRVTYASADTVPGALEVRGTGPVAATLGLLSILTRNWATVTLPLTVVDSGRGPATVRRPELESFVRNAVADTAVQVDFGRVEVLDLSGDTVPAEFRLLADESRRLRLRIPGIDAPGRYSGSVRVAGKDLEPVVTPITVYVRRSGWFAVLLIAAGVWISMRIRDYQQRERPKLLRQRRAAELLEWLASVERQLATTGGMTEDEAAVAAKLRMDLERIYDRAGDSVPDAEAGEAVATDAATRLDLATARLELLPDWANARRQVKAVKVPEIRDDLDAKLTPVGDILRSGTADDLKTAAATVRGIPADITKALRERLESEIETFRKTVEDARAANPTDDDFLTSLDAEVDERLTDAEDAAKADRLAVATAEFDRAREAYADLLARELQLRLGDAAPGWMKADDWTAVKKEVETALGLVPYAPTPEDRIARFNGALGLYLRSMAAAMAAQVVKDLKRAGLSDAQKASLEAIAGQAQAVLARVAAKKVHDASTVFTAAEKAYRELIPDLPKPKGGLLGPGQPPAPPTPDLGAAAAVGGVPGAIGAGGAVLVAPAPIRLGSRQIEATIREWDTWVSRIVAVIAVVVGVSLLWAGKLTWGSAGDLFTAFLWGLGLHQVGTAGAGGLLGQLLGKESDAAG